MDSIHSLTIRLFSLFAVVWCWPGPASQVLHAGELSRIRVADDGKGFSLVSTGERFIPWGFNYDHDENGRLLEDYWTDEWPKVEEDFAEIRALGANVVRIHLQVSRFLTSPDSTNQKSLDRLKKLLKLAESKGLYLDLTGLGCYHKQDVPKWYDELSEEGRWNAQALFWEAVARTCRESPALFCYDLMNEPVVPGGDRKAGDWLGPAFGDKHFVQVITLSQGKRERPDIAKAWIDKLVAAVRREDPRGLVTVGLVDWSLDRPGLTSGFVPDRIAEKLDFLCVHVYPQKGKVDEAIDVVSAFARVGKPVLIEETFPLQCTFAEFSEFVSRSREFAAGWVGFYWGKTRDEYRKGTTFVDGLMAAWLEYFEAHQPGETSK